MQKCLALSCLHCWVILLDKCFTSLVWVKSRVFFGVYCLRSTLSPRGRRGVQSLALWCDNDSPFQSNADEVYFLWAIQESTASYRPSCINHYKYTYPLNCRIIITVHLIRKWCYRNKAKGNTLPWSDFHPSGCSSAVLVVVLSTHASTQPACCALKCPFTISLAASLDPISSNFPAKAAPIYTRFQPFQTDTFNSFHCGYQGLSREIKKRGRKRMDTAVCRMPGFYEHFELSNPNTY